MGQLRAELVLQVPDRDRFAELARAWFADTRATLFPDFDRGLNAGPPPEPADDPDAPLGPPGGAGGAVWVRRKPTLLGGSRTRYSEQVWHQTLDGLAATYPFHTVLSAELLDERGHTERNPFHGMTIGVHRLHQHPDWVTFNLRESREDASPMPDDTQDRWAEFLRTWAARIGAPYGHVTDDPEIMGGTALEDATGLRPEDTVPRCHELLRGYSWVTVCAAEPAARLGGAPSLRESGAFAEVGELPGGPVFLRATTLVQEYSGEALRGVFRTLAPVLLPGRPHPGSNATRRGRLVPDVDAADYR